MEDNEVTLSIFMQIVEHNIQENVTRDAHFNWLNQNLLILYFDCLNPWPADMELKN